MRNRQLVASWAYEKGMADNVIEKKVIDGKTYFEVNDYEKLRELFGKLLREIQRIKSEGDFEAVVRQTPAGARLVIWPGAASPNTGGMTSRAGS